MERLAAEASSNAVSEALYVREVLDDYRETPGTTGRIHRADRIQAARWYAAAVPLAVIKNALILGAARRMCRSPELPSLAPIRSLAYFVPVVAEVRDLKVGQEYFGHIRDKLRHLRNPDKALPNRQSEA